MKKIDLRKIGLMLGVLLAVLASSAIAEDRLMEGLTIVRECFGDIKRVCSGVVPGEGRIKACVKEKLTQLSPPCFDALVSALATNLEPPADWGPKKVMRFNNLRGVRYCELNFIYPDLATEDLYTEMFNSSGLNNQANPKDTCPTAVWAKVNAKALAKEHGVLGVWKNGPRGWTMDWIELPVGDVQTFDGWQARWMARPTIPKGIDPHVKGSSAYKPLVVKRTSTMTFEKGKAVFILDDPQGTPWVMQAWAAIVDPKLTYEQLPQLGSKLKPAPGWKFRVAILNRDLTIRAIDGWAHIMQDDLQNTYDQCFEEKGQAACNFKP